MYVFHFYQSYNLLRVFMKNIDSIYLFWNLKKYLDSHEYAKIFIKKTIEGNYIFNNNLWRVLHI